MYDDIDTCPVVIAIDVDVDHCTRSFCFVDDWIIYCFSYI
jgi:hypothetical protein